MASGDATVYIDGDTRGIQKAARDAQKEMDNVARSADKANTKAAASATKFASGILRMVESGKVSAKSLDKLGKSASGVLGILSPIGVGLGLGAVPALSDAAVFAIGKLKESLIPLSKRVDDVAESLGNMNNAQLALTDSQLGLIDSNQSLTDSLNDFDKAQKDAADAAAAADAARKGRIIDTKKIAQLTLQHHNALRALTSAEISQKAATRSLNDAVEKHGKGSSQAASAQDRLEKATLRLTGAQEKERDVQHKIDVERRGHKATKKEIAELTDKEAAATERANKAATAAAHAQSQVIHAQQEHDKAQIALTKSTDEFDKKLASLTKTANANNSTMGKTGRFQGHMAVDQKKAAEDVAAGLRKWADSQGDLNVDVAKGARAAADLIAKEQKIPKDIKQTFAQPGIDTANKSTDLLNRLTSKIKPKVTTKVATPGLTSALGNASNLFGALNRLDGKTVTTKIINVTVQRSQREGPGAATGAMIGGSPNSRDDIGIRVSSGEVVLNPRQQSMVDSGYTVAGALSATGAPTIYGGGSYARGGKKKKTSLDTILSRSKDRFGALMSQDDLRLARAEQTPSFADDAKVLTAEQAHIKRRIRQIHSLRRKYGRRMTPSQRQDLNDEEASLIRQLGDIGGQLHPAPDDSGGGGDTTDPFAQQRAIDAAFASGLGRAVSYVFGGTGDIGSGGASALGSAGSVATLHVANVVIKNTPQNQTQLASAGNTGNALVNRGRVYATRSGTAFGR